MVDLYFFDGPTISAASLVTLRIQPEGSTQVFTCPVLSTWAYGVRAILPLELPAGAANITLAVNGEAYPATAVTLVPAAPALFSVAQFMGGWGALAQNLDSLGAPSLNRLTNPALPGQYVTLWGSGLGNLTTADVSVDLAGERIPAYFAGHSPGIPGMDQISFRIPAGAYDGCYVPVVLRADGLVSNSVTIAKASAPGACVHPLGLSASQMKTLDDGGGLAFGSVSIGGGVSVPYDPAVKGYYRGDSVFGQFSSMGAAEIGLLSPTQSPASGGAACQITNGANSTGVGAIFVVARPQGSLVLTGPAGQTLTADGYFSQYFGGKGSAEPVDSPDQLPPPFFSAGTWTLDVSGDPRVAAFQHTFQLPPELNWTNRGSLNTVSRASDTAITWDPAGYSATDVATVNLSGGGTTSVDCHVPATSGSVTIPRSLLQQLPATADGLLRAQISSNPPDRVRFDVPMKLFGSMPVILGYGFGDTLRVVLK
jgi:uncharacterized protein (TIGR03437 family)